MGCGVDLLLVHGALLTLIPCLFSTGNSILDGLPELGPRTISNSAPHPPNHLPVKAEEQPFHTISTPLVPHISSIWALHSVGNLDSSTLR